MGNLSVTVLYVIGKGRKKQGNALDKYAQQQEGKSRILCPFSLNTRYFREVAGLVRDASCLHAPEEGQELQKLKIF